MIGRHMEAFSHFTYHRSCGSLIVCALQRRYRYDRYGRKSRFELTDVAICSRRRMYGITDMGVKGIESFFDNYYCNDYCRHNWQRPRHTQQWFSASSATSMIRSSNSHLLSTSNNATFSSTLQPIYAGGYDGNDY